MVLKIIKVSYDISIINQNSHFKSGLANKASVQQGVHRMSVGHDERLVVVGSAFFVDPV